MTHEFGIVEMLVGGLLKQLEQEQVTQVTEVRFRRGSAFSEEALRQAFTVMAVGTPLEGAQLIIETVNLNHDCPCGHHQIITSDDLIGHMFVCPECGTMREVEEAHDLELIEVQAVQESPS